MHRKPDRLRGRPVNPVFHMLFDQRVIAQLQFHDLPALKLQCGLSLQHDHPFIVILIIPEIFGTGLA